MNFDNLDMSRVDPQIDFNWGGGSPQGTSLSNDGFSIRWTGLIEPVYTGTYTIYENSDDGCRVYINNQAVINRWEDHAAEEYTGTIDLNAGQKYDIRVEYYENGGDAVMQLSWSSMYQQKEIIPQNRLYSNAAVTPGPTVPPGPTDPPSTSNLGDVNEDGNINIVDALQIARYYVNLNPSPFNPDNADTNCDGRITITDALLVAQYYVNLIQGFCQ
jgi:hypothetical protein